jgi:hypothetical protein
VQSVDGIPTMFRVITSSGSAFFQTDSVDFCQEFMRHIDEEVTIASDDHTLTLCLVRSLSPSPQALLPPQLRRPHTINQIDTDTVSLRSEGAHESREEEMSELVRLWEQRRPVPPLSQSIFGLYNPGEPPSLC